MTKLFIRCPILSYHQITSNISREDFGDYAVSESQFAWQMEYLHSHGYKSISLEELLQSAEKGEAPRGKAIVLTFDDGYEDFFTTAYPILKNHGFTATVFLVSDLISLPEELRLARKNRYLSWEQIRDLQKAGITFGSHTASHQNLSALKSDEIRRELTTSKSRLEAELGQEIKWLAYPNSASNSQVEKLVEEAGYQAAFSGSRGRNSRFDIRRQFCMKNDTPFTFIFRLSRLYASFARFRDETDMGQYFRKIKHTLFSREA